MHLGTKLTPDYESDADFQALLHGLGDPLPFLRSVGLDFIEFPVRAEWDGDRYDELSARCTAAGLRIHLHPYLEGQRNPAHFQATGGNPCRENLRSILEMADRMAGAQRSTCRVILHGAAIDQTGVEPTQRRTREDLTRRTHATFQWAGEQATEQGWDVDLALENFGRQRKPNRMNIGETPSEAWQVVAPTRFGLCWDTGHDYRSVPPGRHTMPSGPTLERIVHVHLHNVANDRDHEPVFHGDVPLRDALALLRDAGFDGEVNLELGWKQISECGTYADVMRRCVQFVRSAWG